MSTQSDLKKWDRLVMALEDQVSDMPDAQLLATDSDGGRVGTMRAQIASALKTAELTDASLKTRRVPKGALAQRDMLRYMMARRRAPPASASATMSYSSPDSLSDAEVEATLRALLREQLRDK